MELKPLTGLFTRQQTGMREKEFNLAAEQLMKSGIVEKISKEGKTYYQLTYLGKKIISHFESEPSKQN